jgi:hypothetical protein
MARKDKKRRFQMYNNREDKRLIGKIRAAVGKEGGEGGQNRVGNSFPFPR